MDAAVARETLLAIQERFAEFEEIGARVIAVSPMSPSANAWLEKNCAVTFSMLADPDGEFSGSYGVKPGAGVTLNAVLDRNGRLLKTIIAPSVKLVADGLLAACKTEAHASNSGTIDTQAPVLQIPRIFEPAFCEELIAYWHSNEKRENEITRNFTDSKVDLSDANIKRRSDVLVPQNEDPLNQRIRQRLSMRVVPEIEKAFQFHTSAYDIARIVFYDSSDSGFFSPHRDVYNDDTDSPRRFAISINLNDDYEGGVLRFAEYGMQTYNPPPGSGVVFSCRLLHEVLPVIKGQRFGAIMFFY